MKKLPLPILSGCESLPPGCRKLLSEEYYAILLKVAFRYVSTYEQAAEATHKGFLRLFRECSRHRSNLRVKRKDGLLTWMKRVFIIMLVDHIKAEPDLHIPRPIPDDRWLAYEKLPSDTEKMHIELIKILKELPVSSRLVFNLHVIDGFSHHEMARMLDITVKASKRKLIKAREELQQALSGNGQVRTG